MTLKTLAVETARYHSRMAVRSAWIFREAKAAAEHRVQRDTWMAAARKAKPFIVGPGY